MSFWRFSHTNRFSGLPSAADTLGTQCSMPAIDCWSLTSQPATSISAARSVTMKLNLVCGERMSLLLVTESVSMVRIDRWPSTFSAECRLGWRLVLAPGTLHPAVLQRAGPVDLRKCAERSAGPVARSRRLRTDGCELQGRVHNLENLSASRILPSTSRLTPNLKAT